MTTEQKQAYSNLMGTLVAGVTAGVGGDAAAATLAGKIEVENNYLGRLTANGYNQMIDKQCGVLPTHAQSGCVQGIKDKAIATSDRLNKEMIAACTSDPTSSVCSNARESARWFIDSDVAQSLGMWAGSRAALIKADALVAKANADHYVNTKPVVASNKPTKPPVSGSIGSINIIDDSLPKSVGDMSTEEFISRAAANGLHTDSEIAQWIGTLPSQAQVCSGVLVSDSCGKAYLTNITSLIQNYPGVPVEQLSSQLNVAALLSRKGEDSFGTLSWDAIGKAVDLAAIVDPKADKLATAKTIIDIAYQFKNNDKAGAVFDIGVEGLNIAVEKAIEKKIPGFSTWPQGQKDIYINSVTNVISLVADNQKSNTIGDK